MKFPHLNSEEKSQLKDGVIQVNGKAMNRTALGIIAAYFKLFPNSTFAELKAAFPDSINPSGPKQIKSIFKPYTDVDFGVVHSLDYIKKEFGAAGLPYEGLFFTEKDEMFKTSDGITVVVNRLWESKDTETGESDLENLAKVAVNYGIVVNKFEARSPFTRGTYSLDILKPALFAKISNPVKVVEKEVVREREVERKVIPFWIWIVLVLAFIPFFLWFLGAFKSAPEIVEREVVREVLRVDTVEVIKVDTVYFKEIEELEEKFNAVQFAVNKYDIPEQAKFPLYDLSKLLKSNPNIMMSIEGHTSDEGDSDFNQRLSENRAKAVVDFLIEQGASESQLSYKGLGSSAPKDINNREINRRTEFVIMDQQ